MNKINFTEENEKDLKTLFLKLGFSGRTLPGKFGANSYTVVDLLHNTAISTLRTLNGDLKKQVTTLRDQDEWSFTTHQKRKADITERWQKFINLLIGYKLRQEEKAQQRVIEKEEAARKLGNLLQIKDELELKKLGKMSLKDIKKEIEKETAKL